MLSKKAFAIVGTTVLGLGIAACGGDDETNNNNTTNNTNNNTTTNNTNNNTTTNNTNGFPQPADTTPLSFCIDDTANKTYQAGDGLKWKGSWIYDETTRIIEFDGSWTGPYPLVYDDGPWTAGGHEPAGATAGDSIWCVTAFLSTPTEDVNFEYGAENDLGWIWVGGNGTFTVPAGSTDEIIADPLVIAAHGDIDMRISIDTSTLAEGWTYTAGDSVRVKGSYAAWQELDMSDDGTQGDATADDGVFTFTLSDNVGDGTDLRNFGLLKSGDAAEFVLVLNGVEYKGEVAGIDGAVPLMQAITAEISTDGGTTWTAVALGRAGNNNTTVPVP